MTKDRKARVRGIITVAAIANVYAAIVDTMRELQISNAVIHRFLDNLWRKNAITTTGPVFEILSEMIIIIRETVPDND